VNTYNLTSEPLLQEVIHQICSPSGKVLRIVIFKKNGIQAMVEFDSIESAKRAKQALNGCDIYSGCCTLRVEYAKVCDKAIMRNLEFLTKQRNIIQQKTSIPNDFDPYN